MTALQAHDLWLMRESETNPQIAKANMNRSIARCECAKARATIRAHQISGEPIKRKKR